MDFWTGKNLYELSHQEWESLCDGCGQCCLHKLEDEDSGQIAVTNVACRFLDLSDCRCTCYGERSRKVPECVDLRQYGAAAYRWLPDSCAYRLLAAGKDLPSWHPLRSGTRDSVGAAGRSVGGYAVQGVAEAALEDHVIAWLD